jgi:hypothetical protein
MGETYHAMASSNWKHHAETPYFYLKTYIVAHILLPLIILKMATEMYIKAQEELQQKTQLGLISNNYILDTERKNLGTRIYCHGVWNGEWIYWPLTHLTRNYKQLQHHC